MHRLMKVKQTYTFLLVECTVLNACWQMLLINSTRYAEIRCTGIKDLQSFSESHIINTVLARCSC
jgi:hypothetical protein